MCILCVVQRWSRRVATMLPWLVIPLIILWALSQLLPPGLRFEITSPRLACVLVLLVTLFWYEILLPQLSVWRARRSARMREWRRIQAIELQKLRKTATRRCRNCLTPYRDQNPGGGRFMCSYCGHISKRPVLDIPGAVGSSGIISGLVGKNGWICGHDWSPESNGIWANSAPRYWVGGGDGVDNRCSAEKSYSGVFVSACKLLSYFFFGVRWLWRKVLRTASSREDGPLDAEHKGLSSRKGENDGNFQERRGEKAKRKAEEKRQARLEKEMLEEEERKQREEVARLVEERRKLRDEKLEAEKGRSKGSTPGMERGSRKGTERRQEKRKEKDIGSSKSNSDGEEPEKSTSRESQRKCELDKKTEHEGHDSQKIVSDSYKSHASERGHGNKVATSKTRYFDRMKGTFLSSSRSFNGASFFGRNAQSSVAYITKTSKPATGLADQRQNPGTIRDVHSPGNVVGKSTQNGDQLPMGSFVQPTRTVMKKSWHQLFTRSSAVSPYPDTDTASCLNQNSYLDAQSAQTTDQKVLPNYSVDHQINFGWSLPSTVYPSVNGSFSSDTDYHGVAESMHPLIKEPGKVSMLEEAELFEDPCYVPDPISLLGPVSESLDNFPLDLGAGFVASADMKKPSPIESPMSRLRVYEERRTASGQVIRTPKPQKGHASNFDDSSNANGSGTWQMWGTPLVKDGLDLVGGSSNWFAPLGRNKPIQEYDIHPLCYMPMNSQITKENHVLPAVRSPQSVSVGNHHTGGTFSPLGHGLNTPFQTLPVDRQSHFLPLIIDDIVRNEVTYESPNRSAAGHLSELSPANCWSKGDWVSHGPPDAGNSISAGSHIGGLFPTNPDSQSVWSFQ